MQKTIAKHQAELRESCGRVQGSTEGAGGVKDTIRRPTESTNLGLWWLTDAEPSTKSNEGTEPRPLYTFVVDMQLGFHMSPLTMEQGLSLTLLPAIGSPSLKWTSWLGLNGR